MARSGQKPLDLRARARGVIGRDPVGLDLGFAAASPSPDVQLQVNELVGRLRTDFSQQPLDDTVDRLRRYTNALARTPRPPALAQLVNALTDRLLTDTDNEVIVGASRRMLCALKLEPAATRMIVQQPGDKKTYHLRSPQTDHRTCCGMKIGETWTTACPRGTFLTAERNRKEGIARSVACEQCGEKGRAHGIGAADEPPRFDPFHDDERETLYEALTGITAKLVASLPEEETLRQQTNLAELLALAYLDEFGRLIVYRRLCEREQTANDRLLRELYLDREGVLGLIEQAYHGEVPPVSPEMWLESYDAACHSYLKGRPPARIWPGFPEERFSDKRLRQSVVAYLIVHAFPDALALAESGAVDTNLKPLGIDVAVAPF